MSYAEGGHFLGAETLEVVAHTPDTLPVLRPRLIWLISVGQAAAHFEGGPSLSLFSLTVLAERWSSVFPAPSFLPALGRQVTRWL